MSLVSFCSDQTGEWSSLSTNCARLPHMNMILFPCEGTHDGIKTGKYASLDLPFFLPFDLLHCFPLAISNQKPEVNGAQMVWPIRLRIEEGRKWIWERTKSE